MSKVTEKIIVIANRIPCNISITDEGIRYKKSIGGLVTALDPILLKNGGLWIGWNGQTIENIPDKQKICIADECSIKNYSVKCVKLTKKEIRNYYHGFSNRSIWPLFHGFIFQSYFSLDYWKSYTYVNRKFCNSALEEINGNELIWVHDYHLTLLPEMLKQTNPELKVMFFLHIPFPNFEIFRVLPWNKEILIGLLGCSLLGFQTRGDAINFLASCKELLDARVDFKKRTVIHDKRTTAVKNIPVSIDFDRFNKKAGRKSADSFLNSKKIGPNTKLIISVERLDYTKGIKERILAIERFFEKYPKYRRKLIFLQISVPSRTKIREYISLKKETDELVGRINGRFSDEMWSPIHYIYKAIPQTKLIELYKAADICLVTPLRDGMNLVSKEYVSCKTEGNGVLILSRFAGAADEMGRHAIMVNPYDIEEVADSINTALNLHWNTKKAMMSELRKIVGQNDVFDWARKFLNYCREIC
jgi:alpha,alpha-trehalose-phosphate synthase [UDP-forming]